ncbi:albusnodin family lasso peptide [Streptomyces sp. SID3343]|nr:albusnodin family lasso peptide [Streptomyces sp. SID3343]MYV99058.1 albusnodin family lasso peptide [Streptomyces sp. SID3343]
MKQPEVRDPRLSRTILPITLGTAGALTRGGTTSGSENKRKVYATTMR